MKRSHANVLLLVVALVWGTTFVAQQLALEHLGPFSYTGARFLLGALVIAPLAWRERRALPGRATAVSIWNWRQGTVLGLLLFAGISLQQVGLATTTVTNAGFLTALYMPLVPLLAWLMHGQVPGRWTWLAVAGSVVGTWMLAGGTWDQFSRGDVLILISTIFWALHVSWVGAVAERTGAPIWVAFQQFVVCALLSVVVGALTEAPQWTEMGDAALAIAYGGLMSVGVGFTLQVVAQRYTRPADAAIILSAETLFAGVAGAALLGERLGPLQLAGCALIFASILAVQLMPTSRQAHTAA